MGRSETAARWSIISNSCLVAGKLAAGTSAGSVSIISEALHSGLDLAAALIAFFSIRAASRPADEIHQYGHGKIENISGSIEAGLILLAAVWIIYDALTSLALGPAPEALGLGMLVMGLSAAVNWYLSRYLLRVARNEESIALEADAMHLRTDVYTSAGVVVGLAVIYLTGYLFLDSLIALAVAGMIIKAGITLLREAASPLVDVRLPEGEEQAIRDIIQQHAGQYVEFHRLRTRRAGPVRYVDLHLVVPHNLHVDEVHRICEAIEREVEARFPASQVLIHVEPCSTYCEIGDECAERGRNDLAGGEYDR
ncbi:MAG: cation transporter [Clostridia bacterium]|nr:MAG: cation transporter [Clostridia bacterium]